MGVCNLRDWNTRGIKEECNQGGARKLGRGSCSGEDQRSGGETRKAKNMKEKRRKGKRCRKNGAALEDDS